MNTPKPLQAVMNKCRSHKDNLPYLQWNYWAEEQELKGKKQKQCPNCNLWFFREEM